MTKILLGLLLVSTIAFSQESVAPTNYLALRQLSPEFIASNNLLFFCRRINEGEISHDYMEWKKGILLSTTNDTLRVTARYIPDSDLVELLVNEQTHRLYKEKTAAILIHNSIYVVAPMIRKGESFYTYFQLLYGGTFNLLEKGGAFYIQRSSGPAQKVRGNKRQFAQIFLPYQQEVYEFLKENRLKIDLKNDLIQILQFVHSNFDFKAEID